jgi:hypothetical protein
MGSEETRFALWNGIAACNRCNGNRKGMGAERITSTVKQIGPKSYRQTAERDGQYWVRVLGADGLIAGEWVGAYAEGEG